MCVHFIYVYVFAVTLESLRMLCACDNQSTHWDINIKCYECVGMKTGTTTVKPPCRWKDERKSRRQWENRKRSRRSAFALLWSSSKVNISVAYSTSLVSITVMIRYRAYISSLDKEQTFKNVTLAQEHTSGGMLLPIQPQTQIWEAIAIRF